MPNRNKISELFINSNSDRNATEKNRLSKQLADMKLKKSKLKNKYRQDTDRIERQIAGIKNKLDNIG